MKYIIKKFKKNYKKRQAFLYENGLLKYIGNPSGYVLIVVLLVTTLLVTMSTEFLMVAQTNINYIRKFSERLKADMLAKAGVNLSTIILKADKLGLCQQFMKRPISKNIDCYEDCWAKDFPGLPLEDGTLKINIDDENSKINLSVLANEFVEDSTKYYGITQRFFTNMGLPMDFADIIKDWVDIDDSRSPYGAESSDYYLNLASPYKAKNAAMDSIDELLMLKDITPEIFYGLEKGSYEMASNFVDNNKGNVNIDLSILKDMTSQEAIEKIADEGKSMKFNIAKEKSKKLSDYLRVNGERKEWMSDLNKININTASYRVLLALTDNMTDDIVNQLISRRLANPFNSVEEIKEKNLVDDSIIDPTVRQNILSVKSYIFKITSVGTINKTSVKITGIYYRDGNKFLYWSEQ